MSQDHRGISREPSRGREEGESCSGQRSTGGEAALATGSGAMDATLPAAMQNAKSQNAKSKCESCKCLEIALSGSVFRRLHSDWEFQHRPARPRPAPAAWHSGSKRVESHHRVRPNLLSLRLLLHKDRPV